MWQQNNKVSQQEWFDGIAIAGIFLINYQLSFITVHNGIISVVRVSLYSGLLIRV